MNEDAKLSMLLSSGLNSSEQVQFDRLESRIAEHLVILGASVRICTATGLDYNRRIELAGAKGVGAVVQMSDFMSTNDDVSISGIRLLAYAR